MLTLLSKQEGHQTSFFIILFINQQLYKQIIQIYYIYVEMPSQGFIVKDYFEYSAECGKRLELVTLNIKT